jgi:predicted ATPase
MFKRLSIHGWRQFRNIEIEFHPKLTILTGANGAGKTTMLSLVGRHLGWSSVFISTPRMRDSKNARMIYSTDLWDTEKEIEDTVDLKTPPPAPVGPQQEIGTIEYANGARTSLTVPTSQTESVYQINISAQQHVEGVSIPSHRPTYSYQQVQNIPTVPRRQNDVHEQYANLIRTRYSGGHTPWSPQYYMKETLIALATFGYGNQAVDADPESARLFEEFQEVLKRMLPPKLGFKRLVVRVPEVILDTQTGSFSIDALSGGVAAVIDLAWQVFMFKPSGSEFVVALDEPENHLHPELQRRVLTDLVNAFPSVQFVVATHSPFIVGSVPDSHVYVLDYDDTKRVNSSLLDTVNRAGSANEILRDVLGLEFTMPVWVESKLDSLVERYSEMVFSAETIAALRAELTGLGLAKHAPQTIADLAVRKTAQ